MVPPMAMNWTWRFFRPRSISLLWSRLSTDLMCAVSVASDVLVPVFSVFVFPKVIMFTPYRGSRTISAIVRTAKHTHMPYMCRFASFQKLIFTICADHLECKVVRGDKSYPLTSFFRGTLPHIAQTIFAACQMGGILCKSRGSLPEKPTCQSSRRMVLVVNSRGRDRLVELV